MLNIVNLPLMVCFSCQPCHIKDWEMLLHFKVHGQGDTLFGDGFALWYTKERMQDGTAYYNDT